MTANSKCKLTRELVEGPYYLNDTLFRSNISEDQTGVPLTLRVKVVDTNCSPLVDAFVDVWSCNSTGYYSGYTRNAPAFKLAARKCCCHKLGLPALSKLPVLLLHLT